MYKYLLEMCITLYNEQWYCYLCNSVQLNLEKAIDHSKRTHSIPRKILLFVRSMELSDDEYYKLLFNGIVIIDPPYTYFCVTCQSTISSLKNVYEHIKGRGHKTCKNKGQNGFTNDKKNNGERETSKVDLPAQNINGSKFFTEIKQISQNGLINVSPSIYEVKEKTVSFCYLCNIFIYRDVEKHKLKKSHQKQSHRLQHPYIYDITLNMNMKHKINRPHAAYSCDICNKEILDNNVIEHLEKEHKDETFINKHGKINYELCLFFSCNLCGIILYSIKSLETHFLNIQHTENIKKFIKDTTHDIPLECDELNECTSKKIYHKCVELFNMIHFKDDSLIDILEEPIIYIQKNKNDATYSCIPCRTSIEKTNRFINHFQKKLHQDNLLLKNNISKPLSAICGLKNHNSVNQDKSKYHNVDKPQAKHINAYNRIFAKCNNEILCQEEESISGLYLPADISIKMRCLIDRCDFSGQILEKGFNYENKKVIDRHNKMYQKRFLDIEKIIFTCNEEKLQWIKLNFQYFVSYCKETVYCVICNTRNIASNINTLYEHIYNLSHVVKCNNLRKHGKQFELLKKFIKVESTYTGCYACNMYVLPNEIDMHTNLICHKNNYEKLLHQADNRYRSILKELETCWYNIQYFACVTCSKRFFLKIEFMEHLDRTHKQIMNNEKNINFDFCIKCATLWYITDNKRHIEIYGQHCQLPLHMYLTQRNEFAIRPFPTTVRKLLKAVDRTVAKLLKLSDDILADKNSQQVVNDLKYILTSNNLANIEVLMFGSRYTGLASSNSDIDIYINFGDKYIDTELIEIRSKQIQSCLHTDPKTWRIEEILFKTRVPLIKSRHNLTGLQCDISFKSSPSVKNSRMISFINITYPFCRKLILFLKKWMCLCDFPGYNRITHYALVWLVIFFLQVKLKIPTIATLIKTSNRSETTLDCQIEGSDIYSSNIPELPMSELLLCFFDYYKSFDYMHLVICPLLGHTYNKKHFTEISVLPKEMASYAEQLQSENPRYFNIDSVMCVQDPFDLSHNLTKAVSVLTLKHFKQYCTESALRLRGK